MARQVPDPGPGQGPQQAQDRGWGTAVRQGVLPVVDMEGSTAVRLNLRVHRRGMEGITARLDRMGLLDRQDRRGRGRGNMDGRRYHLQAAEGVMDRLEEEGVEEGMVGNKAGMGDGISIRSTASICIGGVPPWRRGCQVATGARGAFARSALLLGQSESVYRIVRVRSKYRTESADKVQREDTVRSSVMHYVSGYGMYRTTRLNCYFMVACVPAVAFFHHGRIALSQQDEEGNL